MRRRFGGCAVRYAPCCDTPPQGDAPLARQGDHPDPAYAAPAMPKALLIPREPRVLRRQAQPAPGHRHRADVCVPGLGDPCA